MTAYIVPAVISFILIFGLFRKTDIYAAFLSGARGGITTIVKIFPAMLAVLTGVSMLRASGFLSWVTGLLSPFFTLLGIPPETSALILIRPLSGSAALAVAAELISQYGADSLVGKTAAVMLGSTETTFYTAAVYLGACGVRRSRYAIPAALCADLTGFIAASFFVRLFFF